MIVIEGTVAPGRVFARELERKGDMSLHFTLSPWRRDGAEQSGRAIVTVESDLDYVDAWMRDLGHDDVVRITCTSVSEPDDSGDVQALAIGEPMNLVRPRKR